MFAGDALGISSPPPRICSYKESCIIYIVRSSQFTANKAKLIRSITSCVRNSLDKTPASPNTHTFAELVEHGDAFRRTPVLPSTPCAAR